MTKCYYLDKTRQGGKTDKAENSHVLMPCAPGTDSALVYHRKREWENHWN